MEAAKRHHGGTIDVSALADVSAPICTFCVHKVTDKTCAPTCTGACGGAGGGGSASMSDHTRGAQPSAAAAACVGSCRSRWRTVRSACSTTIAEPAQGAAGAWPARALLLLPLLLPPCPPCSCCCCCCCLGGACCGWGCIVRQWSARAASTGSTRGPRRAGGSACVCSTHMHSLQRSCSSHSSHSSHSQHGQRTDGAGGRTVGHASNVFEARCSGTRPTLDACGPGVSPSASA